MTPAPTKRKGHFGRLRESPPKAHGTGKPARAWAQVLQMAFQKKAYTLTDRGTHLAMEDNIDLPILFEGNPALFNPYGIIAVNPKKHPGVNYTMDRKFIQYLTSPEGQKIIANFKKGGKQLFYPDAIKSK